MDGKHQCCIIKQTKRGKKEIVETDNQKKLVVKVVIKYVEYARINPILQCLEF